MELIIAIIILLIMAAKEEPAIIGKILIVLLVLITLAGNIFLLSGNTEQGFMILTAVIVDIALLLFALYHISKKIEANFKEKEKKRIESVEKQISEIKAKFEPKTFSFKINESESQMTFDTKYINTEINRCVKEYKDSIHDTVTELATIDNKLKDILSYYSYSTPDERLEYLSANMNELNELKKKSDSLHTMIDGRKIVLLNEDRNIIGCIRDAFYKLKKSQKCSLDNISINDLVYSIKPSDLNMFSYKYEPLILHFHEYYYCFFSNVILVFDSEGKYINALDPSFLCLSVKRQTVLFTPYSNIVGSDSCCIRNGQIQKRDNYTYSDNVVYGTVSFNLSEKISYKFSSYEAILALEAAATKYVKKYNKRDTLPDFLALMQMVDSDSQAMKNISEKYKANNKNYFCQIS